MSVPTSTEASSTSPSSARKQFITSIAHVNLTVPVGTLDDARLFYEGTLGMEWTKVPEGRERILGWYNIPNSGPLGHPQQIHIAFPSASASTSTHPEDAQVNSPASGRHPCFQVDSKESLLGLQDRIWEHYKRGGRGAPVQCDEPGKEASGMKGKEFMPRFFCRDYANNRIEVTM